MIHCEKLVDGDIAIWNDEICDVSEGCMSVYIKKLGIPEGCVKLSEDDYYLIEQLIVQECKKTGDKEWAAGYWEGYDKGYDDAKEVAYNKIYG